MGNIEQDFESEITGEVALTEEELAENKKESSLYPSASCAYFGTSPLQSCGLKGFVIWVKNRSSSRSVEVVISHRAKNQHGTPIWYKTLTLSPAYKRGYGCTGGNVETRLVSCKYVS